MKPTLLVMAAGMGSRFGGLKQMEGIGPHGETLLDFCIHDALKAGFGKIVFIIRRDFENIFREAVGRKWEKKVPVGYAFQELSLLSSGFQVPPGRVKPWGTAHAIWSAKNEIGEPFAAMNADDYYGPQSFRVLSDHLQENTSLDQADYAMVGFHLGNTLSEYGSVARGVCEVDEDGFLKGVVERLQIEKEGSKARYLGEDKHFHHLQGTEIVSMNLWGFTPALFYQLEEGLDRFLREKGGEEKSEYLIPRVVDELIEGGRAQVKVLPTGDSWFGMTYPQDLPAVKAKVAELIAKGVYPKNLW